MTSTSGSVTTPATPSARPRIRPGWLLAFAAWAIYPFGMGMAWLVSDNLDKDTAEVLKDVWWVLVILAIVLHRLYDFAADARGAGRGAEPGGAQSQTAPREAEPTNLVYLANTPRV